MYSWIRRITDSKNEYENRLMVKRSYSRNYKVRNRIGWRRDIDDSYNNIYAGASRNAVLGKDAKSTGWSVNKNEWGRVIITIGGKRTIMEKEMDGGWMIRFDNCWRDDWRKRSSERTGWYVSEIIEVAGVVFCTELRHTDQTTTGKHVVNNKMCYLIHVLDC